MTTATHRDWKVTTGYRVLVRVGWGLVALAVYAGGVASILGSDAMWWVVAGLASLAILAGVLLPEPVPSTMLTRSRSRVRAARRR